MAVALRDGRIVALETDGFMDASPSEEDRELAAMLAEAFAVGEPAVSRAAARQTLLEALRAPEARGFFEEGAAESADPPLEFDTEELLREAAHSSDAVPGGRRPGRPRAAAPRGGRPARRSRP